MKTKKYPRFIIPKSGWVNNIKFIRISNSIDLVKIYWLRNQSVQNPSMGWVESNFSIDGVYWEEITEDEAALL